jgi:hypothetical protein
MPTHFADDLARFPQVTELAECPDGDLNIVFADDRYDVRVLEQPGTAATALGGRFAGDPAR